VELVLDTWWFIVDPKTPKSEEEYEIMTREIRTRKKIIEESRDGSLIR
jgi:hypothetical protein